MIRILAALISTILLVTFDCAAADLPRAASETGVKEVSKNLPVFPYAQGWFGADDAYSIPLTPTKSVWLFGDTLVANREAKLRSEYKSMPRNSVGISDCGRDTSCTIQYYWNDSSSAKPRSFFDTGREDEWYWPLDGIYNGGKLYISQMIVRPRKGSGPEDPFGFEIAGTQWFVVENPLDEPDKWRMKSRKLSGGDLWIGTSTFVNDGYVLFYSQVSAGEGKGYMTVLRVPTGKLDNPSEFLEYLGKDKKWRAGTPRGDAAVVIDQAISEMSVRYHPGPKKWVAISIGPEFPSNRMVARTADAPIGPWSKPVTIFEFPEMDPKTPGYDKDTFCYATKEHVEFGNSKMVVTYVCNSMQLQKTVANMNIYRPQVLVLGVPK